MKIDYAIVSSDDSHYLDFWPLIRKQWDLLGIEAVLIYFGDKKNIEGNVVYMDKREYNLPIATCFSRYWYACLLGSKVGIISDIDMIPLNNWYFNLQIQDIEHDKYVHINPCIDTYSRLPSCYHIAQGNTFKEVLQIDKEFNKAYFELVDKEYPNKECFVGKDNRYWCYDEFYATEMVLKQPLSRLKFLNRKRGQSGHRLDRTEWNYNQNKVYYDIHCIRPYKENEAEILNIVHNENIRLLCSHN